MLGYKVINSQIDEDKNIKDIQRLEFFGHFMDDCAIKYSNFKGHSGNFVSQVGFGYFEDFEKQDSK